MGHGMKLRRRHFLHLASGAAILSVSSRFSRAQTYPTRPIHFVVPFPAGPNDALARLSGQKLSGDLKQPVVIDTRPGATGTIGAEVVVRAPPDGYTLLFTVDLPITMAPALLKLNYDVERDLIPIAAVVKSDNVLVMHPASKIHSMAELVAEAKAKPGALTFALLVTLVSSFQRGTACSRRLARPLR